jgi:beta-phosphoglucomutase-like phosphatase (HAD superfamily)
VDGVVSAELGLNGKPEADIFISAASNMGVAPSEAVVVEDAVSGVAAGRKGGFGLVSGIARKDNTDDLLQHGADIVVVDLAEITIEDIDAWFGRKISTQE